MSVTTKMNVDVSGFKKGMAEAQASVRTMDAALKKNEASYKAAGNAEEYMAKKSDLLKQKLNSQQAAAKAAEQALVAMGKNGVDPASTQYQKMAQALLQAQTAALETQAELQGLDSAQKQAASSADELTKSVNGIGKKISLDQVINGISKITNGLENAAKKAVELGKQLWDTIMDSASRADDTATMAEMYGIDLDTFLRMQKLVENGLDTSVEAMLGAMDKVNRGVGKESTETMNYLRQLGLVTTQTIDTGFGKVEQEARLWSSSTDLFWKAGAALMDMSDAFDKEAAASAIFGKSWKELKPLFDSYDSIEEYNAALAEQTVNTEDTIRDLAALNDAVSKLEGSWTTLKDELLGAIAPALTKGADAISELLDSLTEYLKTEDGQQMLDNLGKAVEGLFKDISEIDPQEVVAGFVGVFSTIIDGVKWLSENSGTVIGALKAIVIGWGTLKLAGGALEIIKLIDGLKGLGVGAGSYAAAGQAAGSAWGASFAAAAIKAVPWLAGLINLLTPSGTGNDDEYYNGQITETGLQNLANSIKRGEFWSGQNGSDWGDWSGIGTWISQHYESDLWDDILNNYAALNAVAGFKTGQKTEEQLIFALNQLGFTIRENTQEQKEADESHPAYVKGAEAGTVYNEETYGIYNLQGERVGTDIKQFLGEPGAVVKRRPGGKTDVDVTVKPVAEDGAVEDIRAQIGAVTLPVYLVVQDIQKGTNTGFLSNMFDMFGGGHANGLPFVPYDGYLSVLHKGEQVVPAREVNSRSFSSNIYVENMNMGGGMDADALAAAIASRNRRLMAGYGS